MADMSTSEKYLNLVIDRIPKDGSTVDLQPLYLNLVGSPLKYIICDLKGLMLFLIVS